MSRIEQIKFESADEATKKLWKDVERDYGYVSNMKAVLLHSKAALDGALQWYALYNAVKPWLGERRITLFSDAISKENACKLCSSFMNAALIKGGEDPQNLKLSQEDETVVAFGKQLARDPNRISDALFEKLRGFYKDSQIVELTVFGALMILNNIFNNALQVDPDEKLTPYLVNPETAFADSVKFKLSKNNE